MSAGHKLADCTQKGSYLELWRLWTQGEQALWAPSCSQQPPSASVRRVWKPISSRWRCGAGDGGPARRSPGGRGGQGVAHRSQRSRLSGRLPVPWKCSLILNFWAASVLPPTVSLALKLRTFPLVPFPLQGEFNSPRNVAFSLANRSLVPPPSLVPAGELVVTGLPGSLRAP